MIIHFYCILPFSVITIGIVTIHFINRPFATLNDALFLTC